MILALLAEMVELRPYSDDYYCDGDIITYEYENTDPIINRIMLVCRYHSDLSDEIVKQQTWCVAKVIFIKDKSRNKYIVDKIAFENADGNFMVCNIRCDILDLIDAQQLTHLYYELCGELVGYATKEPC